MLKKRLSRPHGDKGYPFAKGAKPRRTQGRWVHLERMREKENAVYANKADCWLVKTEPASYSIEDLEKEPGKTTPWSGVRNYQARNFMRDAMRPGDPVLFYHSVTKPGIVALAEVASAAYPDPTQFDPQSPYFDPASGNDAPRWYLVDIRLVKRFSAPLGLGFLRTVPELAGMELLRRGSRLSVMPVMREHFETILALAGLA